MALVVDLVDGGDLGQALDARPGPLDWAEAWRVLEPIATAVAYAHAQGVVHRDLKPENVLLRRTGDWPGMPMVADFGIAKVLGSESATRTQARMGTACYGSPEQFTNAKAVGAEADVWALGMLAWRMVQGRLPIDPEDNLALLKLYEGLTPVPRLTGVPSEVADAVVACLSVEPKLRPRDAGALLQRLGVAALPHVASRVEAPAPAGQEAQPMAAGRTGAGGRWTLVAAVAGIAVVAAVGAMMAMGGTGGAGVEVVDLGSADEARGKGDDVAARQLFDKACKAGAERACVEFAFLQFHGRGGPVAKEGAHALARLHVAGVGAQCDRGDWAACVASGLAVEDGVGVTKDAAKGVELYRKACDGGSMRGCSALGVMCANGTGVAKDETRAVELYRKACDGGLMRGCRNLGVMYANGTGVAKDEARAVELYREACDGSAMFGCDRLGYVYQNGKGVAKDEARAVELYRKACDGGNMNGCGNLGEMYANGKGVAKEEARAVELYRKACDGGNMRGCNSLGFMYMDGTGVKKDEMRAAELYRKVCDGGEMTGCGSLGVMYAYGVGVAKDEARAVELYRKACDGGNMDDCGNLGRMYGNGLGVGKDDARAVELYRKSCDGGDMYGCASLGVMYQDGQGMVKDEARARELFRKACDGGEQDACRRL
jgi:TPR repeat protein